MKCNHIRPKRLLTTIRIPIQSEFYFEKLISFQQTSPQTPPRTRGGVWGEVVYKMLEFSLNISRL